MTLGALLRKTSNPSVEQKFTEILQSTDPQIRQLALTNMQGDQTGSTIEKRSDTVLQNFQFSKTFGDDVAGSKQLTCYN